MGIIKVKHLISSLNEALENELTIADMMRKGMIDVKKPLFVEPDEEADKVLYNKSKDQENMSIVVKGT